jgi:hypothetical protein
LTILRNYKPYILPIIILLLILGIGLVSSCAVYRHFIPYHTFSSTDSNIDFTFEYASDFDYRVEKYQNGEDQREDRVGVDFWKSNDSITINSWIDTSTDASKKYEEKQYIHDSLAWRNFELIQRNSITLDGISGFEF